MNYELYMGAALGEARAGQAAGERADGAVAVIDDAMVARGRERVRATGDPTAHAPMVVLREAARRMGRPSLSGLILFAVREPCAMCVGALLAADADGLVFALDDAQAGAVSSPLRLADEDALKRRLRLVSGIMSAEAHDLERGG